MICPVDVLAEGGPLLTGDTRLVQHVRYLPAAKRSIRGTAEVVEFLFSA